MYDCMNVLNCQYKSIAYVSIIMWPPFWAEYGLHVFKDPNHAWFQKSHTLEHSVVQIMETLEAIIYFLDLHILQKLLHQDLYFRPFEP